MRLYRVLFVVVATNYFSSPVVVADLVFQPSRLRPGDQYRLLFVTSTARDATSSDIDDYNDFVRAAADTAPIVGSWGLTWKAIASTDAIAARDNTNTNPLVDVGVPVYRVDGQQLWTDNEHLWGREFEGGPSKRPLAVANVTELGTLYTESVFPFAAVWTGTFSDGSKAGGSRSSALGSNVVRMGTANLTGEPFASQLTDELHLQLPLYAISEIITVVPEPSSLVALSMGSLFLASRRRAQRTRE